MNLENEVRDHGERIARLEEAGERRDAIMEQLDADVKDIQQVLGNTATKDDVMAVGTRIDTAINGILRDALNAVPGQHANLIAREDAKTNKWIMIAAFASVAISLIALGMASAAHVL